MYISILSLTRSIMSISSLHIEYALESRLSLSTESCFVENLLKKKSPIGLLRSFSSVRFRLLQSLETIRLIIHHLYLFQYNIIIYYFRSIYFSPCIPAMKMSFRRRWRKTVYALFLRSMISLKYIYQLLQARSDVYWYKFFYILI